MRKVLAVVCSLVMAATIKQACGQCSKQDYRHCVKLADPLLRDPHLIYPDNARDIELVCRTWSFFVDCVKQYTERCFTEARRQEFNKAVENPVSTIHKLCSMPDYRENYMKHAGCMKMTLTQDNHCGRHYRLLVSQVSGEAPTASVCCSHHLFRECVIDHTQDSCEPDSAPFSAAMLDKALSFLREQCANFIPNQLDCPGADFYKSTGRSETRLADHPDTFSNTPTPSFTSISTSSSQHTNPFWATQSATFTKSSTDEGKSNRESNWATQLISSSKHSTTESKGSTAPSTLPSRPAQEQANSPVPWTPSTRFELSTDSGDSLRTSYARGISWSPSSSIDGVIASTSSNNNNNNADSAQTWRVTSSDIWLPSSRPAMIDNTIDEPNQQGLESSGYRAFPTYAIVPYLIISFILFR